MDERSPLNMKVTELKTELGRRGLSQTGLKFDLAQRLQAAMDDDEFGVVSSSSPCFSTTSALSASVAAVADQAHSTSVLETNPKTPSCLIPLGTLMSTVVEEREPPQRLPSRQQIEPGVEEELGIEPIKDDVKQATNRDASSLRYHNTAAVAQQADRDEDYIVKGKDQGGSMEVMERIAIKQSPPFSPFHLMTTSEPSFAVKTLGHHLEDNPKGRDESLITLDDKLFQSIAGTSREANTEGSLVSHHRDNDNVEATDRDVPHPRLSVLLPEPIGSTITRKKQPKEANQDSASNGGNISDEGKKGCYPMPVDIIRQKPKAMTVEDLIKMKLMKRKVRFSNPPKEAVGGVAASDVAAKLAKRARRFGVQPVTPRDPTVRINCHSNYGVSTESYEMEKAGKHVLTPTTSSLLASFAYRGCLIKPKANPEMGDPCRSFFSATKSSQELTGSGPRGVKEVRFSFDPLPKRAKRTIAASSDKNEVPEKRRGPLKVDADVKEVKLEGVSKASTAVDKGENRPQILAKRDCMSEAERKMAEQTAKMMERQRRFSSSGTWVRPKPQFHESKPSHVEGPGNSKIISL